MLPHGKKFHELKIASKKRPSASKIRERNQEPRYKIEVHRLAGLDLHKENGHE
jgi:hypothetical protein